MWKVILGISILPLLGAAYLGYENMGALKKQNQDIAATEGRIEKLIADTEKVEQQIVEAAEEEEELKQLAQTLEEEKNDLIARTITLEKEVEALEAELAEAEEKRDKDKALTENYNEIAALQKELLQIRTMIEEAEIEVTQTEGALAAAKVESDRLGKVAEELKALRMDQEAGIIRGGFESNVIEAYNQWGFVAVRGGTNQGVVERAQLDVYRRGQPICKLLVTKVEPSKSAADIIPGSLAPGQIVQIGDTVVHNAVRQPVAAVSTTSATSAASGTTTGATESAGGDDAAGGLSPFEAEESMEGGEPDPFGGGEAVDGGEPDPFGGDDAMGDEPDPFGDTSAPDPFN